jgi:hypothetical protein
LGNLLDGVAHALQGHAHVCGQAVKRLNHHCSHGEGEPPHE